MSRPPTNKSQPHRDGRNNSVPRENNNHSMEHSEVTRSRVSNQQQENTPKKQSTKERIKNYSNMQRNKLNQKQDPLDQQKVIEQNNKLKQQIAELLHHIDSILAKERDKREQVINKKHAKENDSEILELQDLLRTQEKEIGDNKVVIKSLQRQLDNTYEINKVVDKENELKHKQNELKQLKEEEESLNKIIRNQRDALNFLNNKQEYDIQLSEVKKQLGKAKETNRSLAEELLMAEKQLQRVREQNIAKQKKAQELEQHIKDAKKNPIQKITKEMLLQLEEEVKQLDTERAEEEKLMREKLKVLEAEKHDRKIELERKAIKLSSMEKDIRLNKIIMSEQARLIKIEQSETSEKQSDRASEKNTEQRTGSGASYKPNLMKRQNSREQPKLAAPMKRSDSKSSLRKEPISPATPKSVQQKQEISVKDETPAPSKKAGSPEIEENYDIDFERESEQAPQQPASNTNQNSNIVSPVSNTREEGTQDGAGVYSKPTFMMKKKK